MPGFYSLLLEGGYVKPVTLPIKVRLIWCKFNQHFTCSFYTRKSQKRKKTDGEGPAYRNRNRIFVQIRVGAIFSQK